MRRPLGAALAAWLAAGPLSASPPPELIDRLAAPAFADRERAGRDLLGYGPAAVPALDAAAASHPDPEARRRAADLAARLRRLAATARMAAPPTVALAFRDAPLATAVARLRADTGVPLTLDPLHVADPGRPVTVTTGPLPVWEAVAAFTKAAGLAEVVHPEVAPGIGTGGPAGSLGQLSVYAAVLPPDPPAKVPLVLADGPAPPLPADRSSAVRVSALPPTFPAHRVVRGAGLVHLALDVTPVATLPAGGRWEETIGVRVRRAEDDAGRPVPAAFPDDASPAVGAQAEVVAFGGFAVPQFLPPEVHADTRALRPNPRVVTVPLRTGDRAVKSLAVLDGVVIGEVTLTDQPLLTVPDLPRAVGRPTSAVADVRLLVLAYRADPTGRVTVRLRSDAPNPWTLPRPGRRTVPGLNSSVLWEGGGASVAYLGRYRFSDAAGRPLPPPHLKAAVPHDDGVRQTLELDLEFAPRPGYGPPDRVVVVGERTTTVEVPFRLRNVPLP